MPVDWNNRNEVEQALIKARNSGVSDEDFMAYAREKRASLAGKTLQAQQPKESAFSLTQSRPVLSAGGADVLPPGRYQEALPYVLGAPGQAMKEGIDYLAAETPEQRPTLQGAAARVGAVALAPKVLSGAAKLVGRTAGFAPAAMERVTQSGFGQAAKTLYGKLAPGAEEQLGTEIGTAASKRLSGMQGSALAKDAFVANLDEQGSRIPVEKLASKMQEAITEAETFGGDIAKQARGRLGELADELLSKRQNGTLGLGEYMQFKENLSKQLLKATNPILRQRLGALGQAMDDELVQTLGPGAANHIKTLEIATANRLKLLRNVTRLFKTDPEKVIQRAAGSDRIMRMLNEFEGQFGGSAADDVAKLAAQKSFTPAQRPALVKAVDHLARIGGSLGIGAMEGGPAGFLTYLATSPGMRRQAAKLGLLLSTTSIPQVAATAVTNLFSPAAEEPREPSR